MSSKKARRRQRQEKAAQKKPRFNPAKLFMVIVLGALLAIAVGAVLIDSRQGEGRPGQVWSAEHQHWH